MMQLRSAAIGGSREWRTVINVDNVPRSVTRADLVRMVARSNARNIVQTQINYSRFLPDGTASIVVSEPQHLDDTILALRRSSVSQYILQFKPSRADVQLPPRARGVRGRAEFANKAFLGGNGPGAGLPERGRSVVILGLPSQFRRFAFARFMEKYREYGITVDTIQRIEQSNAPTPVARVLLRLKSSAEAHRIVRYLHRTFYDPSVYGDRYELQAYLVY